MWYILVEVKAVVCRMITRLSHYFIQQKYNDKHKYLYLFAKSRYLRCLSQLASFKTVWSRTHAFASGLWAAETQIFAGFSGKFKWLHNIDVTWELYTMKISYLWEIAQFVASNYKSLKITDNSQVNSYMTLKVYRISNFRETFRRLWCMIKHWTWHNLLSQNHKKVVFTTQRLCKVKLTW